MADPTEIKLIKSLKLPNTIQGDGRYVLRLLEKYIKESSDQINLANGFSAEEINPTIGLYTAPKNAMLESDRNGSRFTWSHLMDSSNLAYYELRKDKEVGYQANMLYRGTENYTTTLPYDDEKSEYQRSGIVYLYACNKDGDYSAPVTIEFSKPYPEIPKDITVTKTAEGSLITFSEIPSDCVGAYIYIGTSENRTRYEAKQNIFLYHGSISSNDIGIVFYDDFGEGAEANLSAKLPDVTGFLVERNDSQLDFYWDNINVYGVKYLVKVGTELSWEQGVELFRTATNDKNRRLYPNTGSYYLMVKAYDDSGRFSENAAFQLMNNEPRIDRNIILEYNQQDSLYSGNKINVYYDPTVEGVTLDRDATKGEYIFNVSLNQNYRARNWLAYQTVSVSNEDITWDDANFSWEDCSLHWAGVIGNIDSSSFRQELATKKSEESDFLFSADLNGDTETSKGTSATESQHCDNYANARWANGLKINPNTRLSYTETLRPTFAMQFWLKTYNKLPDTVLAILSNGSDWMALGYDSYSKEFYLRASVGEEIRIPHVSKDHIEYYFFVISQDVSERSLYIYTYNTDKKMSASVGEGPIGTFNRIYCYPRLSA